MWSFLNGIIRDGDQKDGAVRGQLLERLRLPGKLLVTAQQVHSATVAIVTRQETGSILSETDGLLTAETDVPLAIFTADCVPVFLGDKKGRAVGVVHAGWKGLASGILRGAVALFSSKFGVHPCDLSAAIGPHIQKCCYEVGDELRGVFHRPPGETHLDLDALAAGQLSSLGVGQISSSGRCTCHEQELFYSYRREKTACRMMSFIQLQTERGQYEH